MTKGVVAAVLGFLGLSLFPGAQLSRADTTDLSLYSPELLTTLDASVLLGDLSLPLLDGRHHLPVTSALGRMGTMPADLFPLAWLRPAVTQKARVVQTTSGKEPNADDIAVSKVDRIYTGGEVGVLYGHSSGKFGGDDFATYIQGEVGTDKFRISVGAAYEESSVRLPRFGR
jgi:hypothetical protein